MITESARSVAASLLCSEECRDLFAADGASPEWFDLPLDRAIAWAAMRLHSQSEPVDIVTVGKLIASEGKVVSAIGGNLGGLAEVLADHVTDSHFRWHLGEVRDEWTSRQTKRILLDESEQATVDPGGIARKLDELAQASVENTLKDARAVCMQFMTRLERDHELAMTGGIIETGFKQIDAYTGGLKPEYWVIGARPSVGKTSLALSMLNQLCRIQEVPCMFASIEMPSEAVVQRLVSMLTGIAFNDIAAQATARAVNFALSQIAQCPLFIEDGNITVEQLAAKAAVAKRRWGIKVIVVDYLQFLRSSEARKRRGDRRIEVGEISRQLKNLSRDLELPVIVLAQLSRDQDKRGTRPKLSDLKESGDIEQDADMVGLLYESGDDADMNDSKSDYKRLSLDIAKQRNGKTGQLSLAFEKNRMQFSDWQHQ